MTRRSLLRVAVALVLQVAPAHADSGVVTAKSSERPEPVTMIDGWQYRWGDSPVGDDGTLEWLGEDRGWQRLSNLDWTGGRDGAEWIWYRRRLPRHEWVDPTLYLPNVSLAFDVFLGTDLIYSAGIKGPDLHNKYTITDVHVIPLPSDYAGKTVSIRVYSNVSIPVRVTSTTRTASYRERWRNSGTHSSSLS